MPNPVLFQVLYKDGAVQDRAESLPHLLRIDAAHVIMLADRGILPKSTAAALLQLNRELSADLAAAGDEAFPLPDAHRGLYVLYEQRYIERLGGEIGGASHVGRSRNDINATVTRLRLRSPLIELLAHAGRLLEVIADVAVHHTETVMSGFTHMQPAQPSTLGHYLSGVLAELTRSVEKLDAAYDLVNCSPMGAGAGFGTSFPVDREQVAELLGFSAVIDNSADAVASRDYIANVLGTLAVLGITLTRLATDFQTWASAAYGFLDWPDDLVSTSSIMPQKRNAFVLETIRGEAAIALGAMVNTLLSMKNTPFSNSVEVSSEASAHVWPALAGTRRALVLTSLLLEHLEVRPERMLGFLVEANTTMTALADLLVARHGLAFRSAHEAVSAFVNSASAVHTAALVKTEVERAVQEVTGLKVDLNEAELGRVLDPGECARAAKHGGGPAPKTVISQIASLRERNKHLHGRLDFRRESLRNAEAKLEAALSRIVNDGEIRGHANASA